MAEISSLASLCHSSEPVLKEHADPYSACDDEIPTIDYSLLFSQNPNQQLHALQCLHHACLEYGFFYVTLFALVSYNLFSPYFFMHACFSLPNLSSII